MKANELKYGNCVNVGGNNVFVTEICKADTMGPLGCTYYDPTNEEHEWSHQIDPIPITPEILEKCGFETDGNTYYKSGFDFDIYHNRTGFCLYHEQLSPFYGIYISNLHWLQNLFFALTGEELEVEL